MQDTQTLPQYLAAIRYDFEVGGTASETFGQIQTDRATQAMLGNMIQSIDLGIVTAPINFKTPGGFLPLSRATLVDLATVIAAHAQDAFAREARVLAEIDAGTVTTREQASLSFFGNAA